MSIFTKRNKYNCFQFKFKKNEEKNDHWLKYEN